MIQTKVTQAGAILGRIGEPALLEQLAEECSELAKAALKLARYERNENPTPITRGQAVENLVEEIADVNICINAVWANGVVDAGDVEKEENFKMARIKQRLATR